jgi:hypothetical protein
MSSADQTTLKALADAQAALARYIEPGGPGEADTINALLGILDNEPLIRLRSEPARSLSRLHRESMNAACFSSALSKGLARRPVVGCGPGSVDRRHRCRD